jgi:hypothetical protein
LHLKLTEFAEFVAAISKLHPYEFASAPVLYPVIIHVGLDAKVFVLKLNVT